MEEESFKLKTVKLLEATKTITPKTKIKAKDFLENGQFPIVSQESGTINGYWNKASDVMAFDKPVVVFGDHTRAVKYIDFDFVAGADGAKILKPYDELDSKYLYYWFLANPIKGLGYARHFRILKEKNITIPSHNEQKKIVERLDRAFEKIDRAIGLTLKNKKSCKELFLSMRKNIFDQVDESNYKKLGEICELKNGRAFKKTEWRDMGTPIIRIQNLNNPEANFNYFDGDYDKSIEISNGDLLFSWSGTVGTSFGPHLWSGSKAVLNQHIYKVSERDNISKIYLYHYLKEVTSEIEKHTKGAGGLVHVTKKQLENTPIPLPPSSKQTELNKQLNKNEKKYSELSRLYSKKFLTLHRLKQSMLQEAFQDRAEV